MMKLHIKDPQNPNDLIVQLSLDIPECLQTEENFQGFNEYFEYFIAEHFHLVNLRSLQFKSDCITGNSDDLNKFVWLVIAHQAYLERNKLLEQKVLLPIERKVSEIFNKEKEPFEWFQAYHRLVDLYLKSKLPEAKEFLPVTILPIQEIQNMIQSIEHHTSDGEKLSDTIRYS